MIPGTKEAVEGCANIDNATKTNTSELSEHTSATLRSVVILFVKERVYCCLKIKGKPSNICYQHFLYRIDINPRLE